jgi:hypothetical protein
MGRGGGRVEAAMQGLDMNCMNYKLLLNRPADLTD